MSYTAAAVLGVAGTVLLDLVVLRTALLRRRVFWVSYAILLFFQLVINGVLTCRHVVSYDSGAILGPRIACAPVEDLLFGFALVTQTLVWWVWLGRRAVRRAAAPRRPTGGDPAPPAGRSRPS